MKCVYGRFKKADCIVDYAGYSDRGCVRNINEDDFLVSEEHGTFAVADGVGGLPGGEIASALALQSIQSCLENEQGNSFSFFLRDKKKSVEEQIRGGIEYANLQVYNSSRGQNKKYATTIVLLNISDTHISIGNVGDSRAYRFRDGKLIQLTKDHTLAQELSTHHEITPSSPYYNVITRAVGAERTVSVDFLQEVHRENDCILLCSDGLTSMISHAAIENVLASSENVSMSGKKLIQKAIDAGGRDNVTVIVIKCSLAGE